MAEGLFKKILKDHQILGVTVQSAGTDVFLRQTANEKAILAMEEMGIDIKKHISQPLEQKLIDEADLILTMTKSHKERLVASFPHAEIKTFVLKEYLSLVTGGGSRDLDIMDPYGQDLQVYRKTAMEIKEILSKLIPQLFREN